MKPKNISGIFVPMITPVNTDYQLDEPVIAKIIQRFIAADVFPFILGTTGEAPSVSVSQKKAFVEFVCSEFQGKTKIFAGISDNCFATTVDQARRFFDMGVDTVVATLPSYYSLKPEQMQSYFEKLTAAIKGPLIIYNIPSTTHMSIPLDIIDELSHVPEIVGLKDSERDLPRLQRAAHSYAERNDFSYLMGWAAQSVAALQLGADGLVPSTANFVPEKFRQLYDAVLAGDFDTAQMLQHETDKIAAIYQKDRSLLESLAALKVMMNEIGLCDTTMLMPMTGLHPNDVETIRLQTSRVKEEI